MQQEQEEQQCLLKQETLELQPLMEGVEQQEVLLSIEVEGEEDPQQELASTVITELQQQLELEVQAVLLHPVDLQEGREERILTGQETPELLRGVEAEELLRQRLEPWQEEQEEPEE